MPGDQKQHEAIVSGKEHLDRIILGTTAVREKSVRALQDHRDECSLIGTALSALFQAGTCHRGCNHGPHIFEAVCGRSYNLGASAYLLAMSGFYDEAGNLIRGIGEIGNLVSLSVCDKTRFRRWLESDDDTRRREFTPAKVRKAVQARQGVVIADADWYSRFCQAYTHLTPNTKPGMHNASGQGNAGGVYQRAGLSQTFGELATVLGSRALFVCKYFKFEDLFDELVNVLESVDPIEKER